MNEDKIIQMLLKHDEDIVYIKENMATKDDIRGVSDTLDKLLKLSEKWDQESVLQSFRLRQVQDTLDRHSEEIAKIKVKVGLV